jgi:Na+-driven multidrug efflux pump
MAIFLLAWAPLTSLFGVTGLWWAFIVYVCARAAALMLFYGSLRRIIGHGGPDTS